MVCGEVEALKVSQLLLGEKLKRLRESAGLHQLNVAKVARISTDTISRIENGHGNPTLKLVKRIVKAIEQLRK